MGYRVVLRPIARRELRKATEYIENHRSGYGSLFVDEVERILRNLGRNPRMYLRIAPDLRRALMRRFRYAVFKVQPNRVDVFAIFHTSRDPAAWQARI